MSRIYRYAVAAGVVPLLTGTAIFLLWLVTGWGWLTHAGVFAIIAGLLAFVLGCVALAAYTWNAFSDPQVSRRRFWWSTLGCAALLFSNFPVALGFVVTAITIETSYTVVVFNDTSLPLEEVRLLGGGCDVLLGSIPPGQFVRQRLWFDRDGALSFFATQDGLVFEETIEEYVTGGVGGTARVSVQGAGADPIAVVTRHPYW